MNGLVWALYLMVQDTGADTTSWAFSKGYKVREIETDDGAYEVDVVKNGMRMGIYLWHRLHQCER